MSYLKIWIHFVWTTKNKIPLLTTEIKPQIIAHIKENAVKKNIYIDCLNGGNEHLHCLISMRSDQSPKEVMQLIKGESSFWINKNKITSARFEWQDDYYAESINYREVAGVRKYILNQEEHHRKITFTEEYNDFLKQISEEK